MASSAAPVEEPSESSLPEPTIQQKAEMMADEDPLLISQSLTYVTDDGGILHSFQSAQFSTGKHTQRCVENNAYDAAELTRLFVVAIQDSKFLLSYWK
jgi:hypothetical protein